MARQSSQDKAMAAAMAHFAKAAAATGIDLGDISPVDTYIVAEQREDRLREADGVMLSLNYPQKMTAKKCNNCGEPFMTNYMSVGSCSTLCRRAWFKKSVGIDWDFTRAPVWGDYEPPLVIAAESVTRLEKWANKFLADIEMIRTQTRNSPPESDQFAQEFVWGDSEVEPSASEEIQTLPTENPTPVPSVPATPQEMPDMVIDLDFDF